MAIEVITRQYEFAHGHAPRGNGLWAFEIRAGERSQRETVYHNGTYTEAKRRALIDARALCRTGNVT